MIMRIFALLMAAVFVVFAALQYNDPDPIVWIPIYLYVALLSVWYYRGGVPKVLLLVSAALFLAGAVYMWPAHWEGVELQQGMKTANIEHGRESLGLGLCVLTMVLYALVPGRPQARLR
ncbi:MAG: transmembrane 220 family protein [Adhaeribacter sp.]